MGRIKVMSDVLASQVAAGEVVERPASVVKELIENSLDAGAREVIVEVRKGGVALMKVRDDGLGMSTEDAVACLERHATSKLKEVEELDGIRTLGFRGEAVPSIASVSRFRLLTREKDCSDGTEVITEGGREPEVKAAGCAVGTEVEVKDLFFNVPARRKFLRTEQTESGHLEHEVRMHALASPGVRFVFRKDGRTVFDVPASKDARVRIGELDGRETMAHMLPVKWELQGMQVKGYILPVEKARKTRRGQAMFLNGRPIDDRVVWKAVADAYGERLPSGHCPVAWLWLELPPGSVDVNVHPAKREVRFHRPSEVRNLLIEAISAALRGQMQTTSEEVAELSSKKEVKAVKQSPKFEGPSKLPALPSQEALQELVKDAPPVRETFVPKSLSSVNQQELEMETSEKAEEVAESKDLVLKPNEKKEGQDEAGSFRFLGVLSEKYYLLEGGEGLVLMDSRNARERILFEELQGQLGDEGISFSQNLLVPLVLHLDARDAAVVFSNRENFSQAGMELDEFGGNAIQVRSAPAFLAEGEVEGFIVGLIDELVSSEGTRAGRAVAYEIFAQQFARNGARSERAHEKAGQKLLERLFMCQLPYCTRDGRPTLIHFSHSELERRFGRK